MSKGYRQEHESLGNLLIKNSLITKGQLEEAYHKHKHTSERLGDVLVNMGLISPEDLLITLAEQLHIEYIEGKRFKQINPEIAQLIPESIARKYLALPIFKDKSEITVAMSDPFDLVAVDDIQKITSLEIKPAIASKRDIEDAINLFYKKREETQILEVLKDLQNQHVEIQEQAEEEKIDLESLKRQVEDAPIVKLVDYIISNAISKRASDIHIEPIEKELIIRYRIDGVLHKILSPPKQLQSAIICRIKILSTLDIAERRLPQDGRFTIKFGQREIDLRVSTIPTIFGEKIVLRLLEKSTFNFRLEELGLDSNQLKIFKHHIYLPYGMILLTGPTGSGKSTTLYSILSRIRSPEQNIITIEDPVEYQINGINQIQANFKIGLTFAKGLRSILRQDPDTVMVGEIRDQETAEMAIRSALTGHLVFSTLHTNDAVGSLVRLINMGIEPFLVCSSLSLAVAQRLVRRICPHCKEAYTPSETLLESLGLQPDRNEHILFYRGRGCEKCNNTGYYSRIGLFEILVVNQSIRNLVLQNALPDTIKRKALENGMTPLLESGLHKVIQGITSIEEILKTCIEEE